MNQEIILVDRIEERGDIAASRQADVLISRTNQQALTQKLLFIATNQRDSRKRRRERMNRIDCLDRLERSLFLQLCPSTHMMHSFFR